MIKRIALALGLTLALSGPVTGQPAPSAPFTIAETGAGFETLAEAVAAIGDGQGTIRIAPGRYRQCAVQEAGQITFAAPSRAPSCSTARCARARRLWCCAAARRGSRG